MSDGMCIWCLDEEREKGSLFCGPSCKQAYSEHMEKTRREMIEENP